MLRQKLPLNQFLALINANNPSATNPFLTVNDLLTGINPIIVPNFSALPSPSSVPGAFYWVENSQGIWWLPLSVGGTFYAAGLYYSNGTSWTTSPIPWQATLAQVNAGLDNETFVTPYTLKNSNQWDTKLDVPSGNSNQYVDGTGSLQNNKTIEELSVIEVISAENIPSYTPVAIINNQAYKLDAGNANHKFAFSGFSINGTSAGQTCRIQRQGTLTLLGWGLTPNSHYLVVGSGGINTVNLSSTEFIKVIGYAKTSDTLEIIKDYTSILK